jgi:hypothetical protein
MSVETYFNDLFSTLPPGECLQLTREKWEWILARFGGHSQCATSAPRQPAGRPIYGVSEFAALFNRPVSTMRALLAAGVCGNPKHLKPNGKSYEICGAIVSRLQETVAEGLPLGQFCLVAARPDTELGVVASAEVPPGILSPPAADSPGIALPHAVTDRPAAEVSPKAPRKITPRDPKSVSATRPTRRRDREKDPADLGTWRAHLRK